MTDTQTAPCAPYPPAGQFIVLRAPGTIIHLAPGFTLTWSGRVYELEWGRYGGPIRLRKDGDPYERQPGEGHPFWDGIAAWEKSGRRADNDGNCIIEATP